MALRLKWTRKLALMAVLAGVPLAAAAQFGPRVDPAVVAAGQKVFTTNCSFCHGPDAHGGAEGGPDLTKSAVITGDRTGQQLAAVLKTGRPPRMPAFQLSVSDVTALDTYLRQQATLAQRARAEQAILVGNAQAGAAYFNGAGGCTHCHSVSGDLKGIGSKYGPEALQGRMMLPRGSGGWPSNAVPGKPNGPQDVYRQATVTLASGQSYTGDILYISDYDVTVLDKAGARRTFARQGTGADTAVKVTIADPLQAHLDHLASMSPADMHDLTAYLESLK